MELLSQEPLNSAYIVVHLPRTVGCSGPSLAIASRTEQNKMLCTRTTSVQGLHTLVLLVTPLILVLE